jgi:uncharacterized delta-60 repeat protein
MKTRTISRLRLERLDDRITPAGLDPTFGGDGVVHLDLSAGPYNLAFTTATQADGKVVVLGSAFTGASPVNTLLLTRLNEDGSPDTTFGGDGTVDVPVDGSSAGPLYLGRPGSGQLAVLPDGKIVVAASSYLVGPNVPGAHTMVARLNPDGTPDATFDGDGVATIALPGDGQTFNSLAVLADGSVVLVGPETVSQGDVSVFPPAGFVVPQPDEIVAVRLTSGGQLDGSFGTGGVARLGTGDKIPTDARVAALANGQFLVYGDMLAPEGHSPMGPFYIPGHRVYAARLTSTGTVDTTYGQGGWFVTAPEGGADSTSLIGAGVAADGSLLAVTSQAAVNAGPLLQPGPAPYLFRVTPGGQVDTTFAGDGRFEITSPYLMWNGAAAFSGMSVLPTADGTIYLVAEGHTGYEVTATIFPPIPPQSALVVQRLTSDGVLDATYGHGGVVVVPQAEIGPNPFIAFDATADAASRVVVAGRSVAPNGDGEATVLRIAPDAPTSPLPPEPGDRPVTFPPGNIPPPPFAHTIVCDVNGDGTPDTLGFSSAGDAQLGLTDGRTGATLVAFFRPYEESFTGGLVVIAADLNGDGRDELVVAPDVGGSARIEVLEFADGRLVVRDNFFAFDDPNFRGGARLAAGDVNGDGTIDLAVAAGPGGGPRVGLFDGTDLMQLGGVPDRLVNDFFAFPGPDAVNLRDGAYVAAGDLNGDGRAELVFGAGPGGAPRVIVVDPAIGPDPVTTFFAGGDVASRGGVPVSIEDRDGDGTPELYAQNGANGVIRVYTPPELPDAGTIDDPVLGPLVGDVPTL